MIGIHTNHSLDNLILIKFHSNHHVAVFSFSSQLGSSQSRKSLEQKFIFQVGSLNPHGINERFSFNLFISLFLYRAPNLPYFYSILKHNAIDITDPSSTQDACHMNFVIDLAHHRVSVAQWQSIGARNPNVWGSIPSSWGLRTFSSSHAFSTKLFLFSIHHIPTNSVASFSLYKLTLPTIPPIALTKGYRSKSQLCTLCCGQFTLSTQFIILKYSILTCSV